MHTEVCLKNHLLKLVLPYEDSLLSSSFKYKLPLVSSYLIAM